MLPRVRMIYKKLTQNNKLHLSTRCIFLVVVAVWARCDWSLHVYYYNFSCSLLWVYPSGLMVELPMPAVKVWHIRGPHITSKSSSWTDLHWVLDYEVYKPQWQFTLSILLLSLLLFVVCRFLFLVLIFLEDLLPVPPSPCPSTPCLSRSLTVILISNHLSFMLALCVSIKKLKIQLLTKLL